LNQCGTHAMAFSANSAISAVQWLRVQTMQHARERNRLAHVLQAADPGYGALDAHAEPGVRDAAVLAEIKIPFECFFGEVVFLDALHEEIVRSRTLRSTDD